MKSLVFIERLIGFCGCVAENLESEFIFNNFFTQKSILTISNMFTTLIDMRRIYTGESSIKLVDLIISIATLFAILLEDQNFAMMLMENKDVLARLNIEDNDVLLKGTLNLCIVRIVKALEEHPHKSEINKKMIGEGNTLLANRINLFFISEIDNLAVDVEDCKIIEPENSNVSREVRQIRKNCRSCQTRRAYWILIAQLFEPENSSAQSLLSQITQDVLLKMFKEASIPEIYFSEVINQSLNNEIESMLYTAYSALSNILIVAEDSNIALTKDCFLAFEENFVKVGMVFGKSAKEPNLNVWEDRLADIWEKMIKLYVVISEKDKGLEGIRKTQPSDLIQLYRNLCDTMNTPSCLISILELIVKLLGAETQDLETSSLVIFLANVDKCRATKNSGFKQRDILHSMVR